MTSTSHETIASLQCQIVQNEQFETSQDVLCILCHGFGAPGEDLVPIADELIHSFGETNVGAQFIFPAAPIQLDPGGFYDSRAWWPIDMDKLQRAMETGEFRDLRHEQPPELPRCREMIETIIAEKKQKYSMESSRIVVGGFSQGAMLATDVALRHESLLGGLIVWSGTLLCESAWRELAANRGKLSVVQSHGQMDPILPFQAAVWLADMFSEFGFENRFIRFNNVHTITSEGIVAAAKLLENVATDN
jgi:phospholipase/carboxylesterase